MIKEAYCSYEVSKLLKEKGFNNEPCLTHFWTEKDGAILRPTHQMALAWLREVYKLHIAILWDCGVCVGKNSFCYHIDRIDNYEDKGYNKIGFDSNEEAVEAALKYVLENLI